MFWLRGLLALIGAVRLVSAPIPEPGWVQLGRVTDLRSGTPVRVSGGVLVWTVEPVSGGPGVVVTTPVGARDATTDYVMEVPFETRAVSGGGSTPGRLELLAAGANYRRTQVTWNGVPATLVAGGSGVTGFGPADRGRVDRVDLVITAGLAADVDADGLPDAWEFQVFGDLSRSGTGDLDGDGVADAAEFAAGTDPASASSVRRQVAEGTLLQWNLAGTNAPVGRQVRWLSGPAGSGVTNNLFAWTPTEAQGPSTNEVRVAVTDGALTTTNGFVVVVTEVNAAPVFVGLTNAVVPELVGYTQTISVTDGDVPAQSLTLALVSGPAGAVLTNGVFAWTPTEAQGPSTNEVRISVTDGESTTTGTFTVVVQESTPPSVPEFNGLPVFESGNLRFAIRGSGRVRVETSVDLEVWSLVEVLNVETGVVREWEQRVGTESFRAYRLVRE
jgi:hypothetical protein